MQNKKKRILVAEDNDFVRSQIVKFLQDEDYDIDEVTTGNEASERINTGNIYDLAILDVRMEPMGGFDFIKHMHSENIHIPSILVTGDQDPGLLSEASSLGVAAILIKPVQRERLLKTVEKTLLAENRRI